MNLGRSVRDTLLVAGFEVNRAVRTWRALALILLYVIANVGGAYIFTEALAAIEQSVASSMGVATTRWPGALSEQVRQSEQLTTVLTGFVGDEALVDHIRAYPFPRGLRAVAGHALCALPRSDRGE